MPNKNKLSIFMIKDEFVEDEDIIERYNNSASIDGVGTVYWGNSHVNVPQWANSFFAGRINTDNVFTANARAVLLARIPVGQNGTERIFAVTMGYGKNMLKDNVAEERFGLKVILNTIKPDSLRRINKVNIGGNQKLSNEQLPLKSGISDFGLDINRDLVSNIAGVSDDEDYAKGILAGGDILSLTAEVDITNIVDFLKKTYGKYVLNTYKANFSWVDQIQAVKDTRLIERLDSELIAAINASSDDVWMAVPEIINWEEIKGFKYKGQDVYDDIDINLVKESFREGLTSIEQLKSKRIAAISALDDSQRHSWNARRCLYGELLLDNDAYCINSGKWYKVNNEFVNQVNQDYNNTSISTIDFDDFTDDHKTENGYSTDFQGKHIDDYIVLDAQNFAYGGGHSKIELCDLLSKGKELIHIKPYTGSSTLSHLFNQAAVSAELVFSDAQFLSLANERISEISGNDTFTITDRRAIKVVFGIIHKSQTELPPLPFFSKVSLRYTKSRLQAFGFDVSIKTIKDVRSHE